MANIRQEFIEYVSAAYVTFIEECKIWYLHAKEIWILLLLLFVALVALLWFAKPAPPRTVYMATGEGSYRVLAQKYRDYFAKHGVNLELVATHSSKDNLQRLLDRSNPIQVGFVQGGMIDPKNTEGMLSLGSVDYEPIWVFYRPEVFESAPAVAKKRLKKDVKVSIEKNS